MAGRLVASSSEQNASAAIPVPCTSTSSTSKKSLFLAERISRGPRAGGKVGGKEANTCELVFLYEYSTLNAGPNVATCAYEHVQSTSALRPSPRRSTRHFVQQYTRRMSETASPRGRARKCNEKKKFATPPRNLTTYSARRHTVHFSTQTHKNFYFLQFQIFSELDIRIPLFFFFFKKNLMIFTVCLLPVLPACFVSKFYGRLREKNEWQIYI